MFPVIVVKSTAWEECVMKTALAGLEFFFYVASYHAAAESLFVQQYAQGNNKGIDTLGNKPRAVEQGWYKHFNPYKKQCL